MKTKGEEGPKTEVGKGVNQPHCRGRQRKPGGTIRKKQDEDKRKTGREAHSYWSSVGKMLKKVRSTGDIKPAGGGTIPILSHLLTALE